MKVPPRGAWGCDRDDRPRHPDRTGNLVGSDSLDPAAQLADFRVLADGWLDGDGIAPQPEGLDWLAARFDLHYADDLAPPHLYPMPDGGVVAEWSFGVHEASVEFDLAARIGVWHLLDTGADTTEECVLEFDSAEAWRWLDDAIRELSGAES